MRFYLGISHLQWLERTRVPTFVSRPTVEGRRSFPRALGPWALDSGGFTEIGKYGRWMTSPREYVEIVRRASREIGRMEWAAIQDWMCEDSHLEMSGLSILEHQKRTVRSYVELRSIAPEVRWTPVIQGSTPGQYMRCIDLYEKAGVDLRKLPVVGIGSICRLQSTVSVQGLIRSLSASGLRLHAFGFKVNGLIACRDSLVSSDSAAWSFAARKDDPLPGHDRPGPGRPYGHMACGNCLDYALGWYKSLVEGELADPRAPMRCALFRRAPGLSSPETTERRQRLAALAALVAALPPRAPPRSVTPPRPTRTARVVLPVRVGFARRVWEQFGCRPHELTPWQAMQIIDEDES